MLSTNGSLIALGVWSMLSVVLTSTAIAQAPGVDQRARVWAVSVTRHFIPLVKQLTFPRAECDHTPQGSATVEFNIDRAGRVLSARISKSSGSRVLDRDALSLVRRGSPVPAPPIVVRGSTMKLQQPIDFRSRCHEAEP